MTEKSKEYILALLVSDIDDKRACLRVLNDEFKEARDAEDYDEAEDIRDVKERIERSLRAAESAMEDLLEINET